MENPMFEHLHKLIDGLIEHGAEPGSPALKQVKQYLRVLEVASAADVPALSVDALDALGAFDALGTLDTFDAVSGVADSPAAPTAADFPAVILDDPDSSPLAGAVLSTAPSVTPAAPAAASSPKDTLTTMAFLALAALHATLAVAPDSPVVALDDPVSHTAATDMALTDTDSPAVPVVANSTADDDVLALSVGAFDVVPSFADSIAAEDLMDFFSALLLTMARSWLHQQSVNGPTSCRIATAI